MKFFSQKTQSGVALVEILIGAAIITVGVLAINASFSTYIQYALANEKNTEAVYVLQEGLEVMTYFRDESWLNISGLSTTTPYYLIFNGTNFATTTTPQYIDGLFLREITISDLNRDASDDISGTGTYDPNIKQITSTVSYWQGHATTTKSISVYLSKLQ